MILLSDVLKLKSTNNQVEKNLRKSFNYVSIDSRKANKDDIFIAIKGENNDAHEYLKDVFEKGTELAIVADYWYKENAESFKDKNLIVVKDTTLALGELAHIHRKRLKTKIVAVGGSNGKTSTKEMLHAVLSKKYNTFKTEGNFNNHIGVPLTLLRLEKSHKWCVLEVGCNHFDEIKYLCEVSDPDCGIITNIGKEHLEFFKTTKGVAKAELEMFDYLRKKKGALCFVNADEKHLMDYTKLKLKKAQRITYSMNGKADFNAEFLGYNEHFNPLIQINSKALKSPLSIVVNTFGKPGALNGLAVSIIGLTLGVKPAHVNDALKNFVSGSSKRMELTETNGVRIINDTYNSNPDSVKLGLETLRDYKGSGNKFIVLGDMLELGKTGPKEHEAIGKLVSKYKLNNLFTFGPLSKETSKGAKGVNNNFHYSDKSKLIEKLKPMVSAGDIVYVKGSRGMKMEEVVNAFN